LPSFPKATLYLKAGGTMGTIKLLLKFRVSVAVLGIMFLGALPVLLADLHCIPCSCSGLVTCNGCQLEYNPGGAIGVPVNVTGSPFVTACEPTASGDCIKKTVVCTTLNGLINVFDEECENIIGQYQGPLEVRITGCTTNDP
jgi:hypothetical protein